jgi:AraC family transcriptional regulator
MSEVARGAAAFAVRTVAAGITVEERVQPEGECAQSDSDAHVFVVQSTPVAAAQQRWEGVRREGPMRSGEVALLPAGLPMHWQWRGQVQSLHVAIDAAVADVLLADAAGRAVEMPAVQLLDDRVASHLLERLRMDAVGSTDPLRVEETAQQLLSRVRVGSRSAPRHSLPPHRLNQVADWIDAHLGEPISLADLAAIAGVEASWFTRLFRRSAGVAPYRYVLNRRIIHAQSALRDGMVPAAVAMKCGFVDQAHLTRHFRRIVGVPPAAWAARAR